MRRIALSAGLIVGLRAGAMAAQPYPTKPVRLMAPFPPGSGHPGFDASLWPAELAAMIKGGVAKYAKVVKDAGVKPE